jgi:hypothetical protein
MVKWYLFERHSAARVAAFALVYVETAALAMANAVESAKPAVVLQRLTAQRAPINSSFCQIAPLSKLAPNSGLAAALCFTCRLRFGNPWVIHFNSLGEVTCCLQHCCCCYVNEHAPVERVAVSVAH